MTAYRCAYGNHLSVRPPISDDGKLFCSEECRVLFFEESASDEEIAAYRKAKDEMLKDEYYDQKLHEMLDEGRSVINRRQIR